MNDTHTPTATARRFSTPGCRPITLRFDSDGELVRADRDRDPSAEFAGRLARREFGSRGVVRTITAGAYAEDGSFVEYEAFIGTTDGRTHTTTGRNVSFTMYVETVR